MRLKPSAYLILGMVRGGVGNGYAIKRAVDRSTRFFWSTSFAQVYPELARLEDQRYIIGNDDPHGDRPRRSYRITEKASGRSRTGCEAGDRRASSSATRDCCASSSPTRSPKRTRPALVKHMRDHAEELDRQFREDILPLAEIAPQQGFRFPHIAARLGADYYAWRANWFAQLEAELTALHNNAT